MDEARPSYYAIIPADVRYDDDIPPNAKLLYGEISALIGAEGYCYASNAYFSQIYKMSAETISRLISKLEKAGYIHRQVVKDNTGQIVSRRLYLTVSMPRIQAPDGADPAPDSVQGGIDEKINTPCEKNQEGIDEKVKGTNKSNTNVKKESKKERKAAEPLTDEALHNLFIDWIRTVSGEVWSNPQRNAVYLALTRFYAPREKSKQNPARSEAGFTALSGRLLRLSGGNPAAMVEMLDIATTSLWKSVFPLNRQAADLSSAPADKEEEEWLN